MDEGNYSDSAADDDGSPSKGKNKDDDFEERFLGGRRRRRFIVQFLAFSRWRRLFGLFALCRTSLSTHCSEGVEPDDNTRHVVASRSIAHGVRSQTVVEELLANLR